ncbi:MAG: beta-galactosidase, partial [Clostridiales bacterium]|nr:beta-galactosidase [Clostridiales bacterium]
ITVAVHDDVREKTPRGKQSDQPASYGCFYTRVTGIWQTVWLERTPADYIKSLRFTPDAAHGKVRVDIAVAGEGCAEVTVTYKGRAVGRAAGEARNGATFEIALDETHLWEIGAGRLYDVRVRFCGDEVKSYFGLRDIAYCGKRFTVNGKSVFQRLVLDQGYYPRGLYTPESDAQYGEDIALAQSLGFNGARLHQKVFAPRYLYECDRRGFAVWGEYASWGIEIDNLQAIETLRAEWTEAVEQMRNHPCVAVWCPLNETWEDLNDSARVRDVRLPETMYRVTKSLDPARPCVDVSGGYHGKYTDIADFHCYESYTAMLPRLQALEYGKADFPKMYAEGEQIGYNGEPLALSEFGGVTFNGVKTPQCACVRETQA